MKQSCAFRIWGIRAGIGGEAHSLFLKMSVIALLDAGLGDLLKFDATRESFYSSYRNLHPDETRTGTAGIGGKFYRFIHEVAVGDFIVYPAIVDKQVYVGVVTGEYIFVESSKFKHQRAVNWTHSIPKHEFSKMACQELGAARTFFEFKRKSQELFEKMKDDSFLLNVQ